MSRSISGRPSLAKQYALRKKLALDGDQLTGMKIYYSTSALKGGVHTYTGKTVTRDARDGKIIRVKNLAKTKS